MSLTAPYIWIMTSGVYDVLQLWDQDGSVSYFDIYANGTKVYTLEKDDDIVYVTIEDLNLDSEWSGHNIYAIGYDSDGNATEESNYVCWYESGNYDNDGADPDIISPFKEVSSTTYFYLDGELVETISGSHVYSVDDFQTSDFTVTVTITNPPTRVVINPGGYLPLMYDYGTPLSAVSVSPSTITADTTTYTISVYAITTETKEEEEKYTFNRLCDNSYTTEDSSVTFHHYGKKSYDDCITFISDTKDFTLTATYVEWDGTVEYSTDHASWATWDGSAITSASQKLYLRGYNNTTFRTTQGALLRLSSPAGCYGNINTLLQYDEPPDSLTVDNCFRSLFYGCTNLTTAPELPATSVSSYAYKSMFYGCTSLTAAPELPATKLSTYCYHYMFYGCTSLTAAPELPATSVSSYAYQGMFYGCTSLTAAPELPATSVSSYAYSWMFRGCTSLTTAPALPVSIIGSYSYQGMFYGCTSLTTAPPKIEVSTMTERACENMFGRCYSLITAPELPTTLLGQYCYAYMFYDCTSLTAAPELPASISADKYACYSFMFRGCTSLTTAPKLPSTTLSQSCYSYMFYGCTSLTTAPELPATSLQNQCYQCMFLACTSLRTAPTLPAKTMSAYCYYGMFWQCTSLTTIPALPASTMSTYCWNQMFQSSSVMLSKTSGTVTAGDVIYNYNQAYRIPKSATVSTASYALTNMFTGTKGSFTGTPTINTTYYLEESFTIV